MGSKGCGNPFYCHVVQGVIIAKYWIANDEIEVRILIRYACFKDYAEKVGEHDGGLDNFTQAYKYYGIHINLDNSVTCREWAPGAHQLYLMGDFMSGEVTDVDIVAEVLNNNIQAEAGASADEEDNSSIVIRTQTGELVDRLSPWAVYVVQPPRSEGFTYRQKVWNPPSHEIRGWGTSTHDQQDPLWSLLGLRHHSDSRLDC
ncbi:unnamed protein product [Timema podura]|uniref:Uncharacterized protein n=1 Tax=Timema podura TaxID=61482 RepID=A0ABN7NFD5_TIMPD|nr:unnamed protein product [Timema podura]